MKKGDSVKIEVKSVGEFGIVVHSYKRKEDFSVTCDQLKSKFIERLKPGNPVILRFVSTRPWTLSEKFVHEGRFLFDDYALKPIVNAPKPSANSKSEDFENKIQEIASEDKNANDSGIQNKLIVIVKDNQFDKGWTLFSPSSFKIERNWQFRKADLSYVVKLITFSTQVDLVLSETCLPSRIINELEWSNKYIKINIIAQSKMVLDRYKNLKFNSCRIDESVSINYIGITGRNNGYFMIEDDFCEIDESVENIYFNPAKASDKYSSLEKAKMMIVCSDGKHKDFTDLLSLSSKYGLKCCYVIKDKHFDRAAYDFARNNKIELFISNYVEDMVLIVNKDDSINRMSILNDGHVVLHPIDRISNYVGELYKNPFLNDVVDVDKIPAGVYSCLNGKNEKLEITDAVVIRKDVSITEMSDFVNEIFDKSIIENHNDYSNKGKTTQYFFTLIPPLFDSSYVESSIYTPIHKLQEEWANLNKIKFDRVVRDYREFMNKDSKLIPFIDYSKKFTDSLEQMVSKCSYKGYYSKINEAIRVYEDYQKNIFEDCSFMFNEINSESSGTKFDKFDVEIEGYRKTIKEKEVLIFMGTDVLSNKRRIEILNKKIEDLLALKEKFEGSAASRSNKEADSFIAYCKRLVNGVSVSSDDSDSIGKIVNTSEGSKFVKLNNFVSNYLKLINDYLAKCLTCLNYLNDVHIPEEYPVFEKKGQKYIVIKELNEYEATKELCKEFSLKCLVRR